MTDIVNPVPLPTAPPVPQRDDPATFEDRVDAGYEFMFEDLPPALEALNEATYTNAVAAEERAVAADGRATDAENAKQAAEDARDAAASHEAGAEGAETSAWAAAAAATGGAGLPQPLMPGKVLGALIGGGVGWIDGVGNYFQEFISSGTCSIPPEATWVFVEVVSGGGSGSAIVELTDSGSNVVGGGGGGGANSRLFLASQLPGIVPVTVGAGAAGVSASGGSFIPGLDGGDSSFGTLLVSYGGKGAPFGRGGASGSGQEALPRESSANGQANPDGGSGGLILGGNATDGGGGGGGVNFTNAGAGGVSLNGGNGGAGVRSATASIGGAGQFPGGGGGGARTAASTGIATSGSGASGVVRVWAW